ncbi:alanine racemase [bacterium]|nr:alanine racemase [bacterium]
MQSRPGTFRETTYTPKLAGLDDLGSSLINLEIDVSRYRANLRAIRDFVAPARVIAVLKANAYGFGVAGLLPILAEFEDMSAAVATPDEALELRALGYPGRIILLGYTHPKCYYQILHSGCQLSAYRPENIAPLAEAALELKRPLELHVKVDTGMTRLGVSVDALAGFLSEIGRHPQLAVVGLFSHFADSGVPDARINELQISRFQRAIEIASAELGYRPECHLANSGAVLNFPAAHLDSVRVGLLPMGIYPPGDYETRIAIEPCCRLSSEVIDIHRIKPGEGVSYCHSFISERETSIATLPYGYADGNPRRLSNHSAVLIGGRRFPLVGNIAMDYVMADVGDYDVRLGDEAVYIGAQRGPWGEDSISIYEVAEAADTVSYEITCAWGRRVRRVYTES